MSNVDKKEQTQILQIPSTEEIDTYLGCRKDQKRRTRQDFEEVK